MRLHRVLSIRNMLRASGIISIAVTAPLLIIPSVTLSLYLGKKRPESSSSERTATNAMARCFGIAGIASGIKSLAAAPTKCNLMAALSQELMFVLMHIGNRVSGTWEDAGGTELTSNLFISAAGTVVAAQSLALTAEEEEEKEEVEGEK